jgi:hypothetical protein
VFGSESTHIKYFKKRHLFSNEEIVVFSSGYLRAKESCDFVDRSFFNWIFNRGYVVITNFRIVFYRKGFLGEVLEEIPLANISSLKRKSRFNQRIVKIYSPNSSLEFEVYSKEAERLLIAHL